MLVVARADLLVRVYPHYNDTIQFDRETVTFCALRARLEMEAVRYNLDYVYEYLLSGT